MVLNKDYDRDANGHKVTELGGTKLGPTRIRAHFETELDADHRRHDAGPSRGWWHFTRDTTDLHR